MANQKTMVYRIKSSRALKIIAIGFVVLISSSNLSALGLGALEVHSNLDQPLNGTIELHISAGDDLSSLQAAIASLEDFENLGIAYPSYMKDISLNLESVDGVSVLRVISNEVVIKEPFIHFLVRIDWSGGSFLREYTALIDPPIYAAETPKSLSQPRSVGTDQSYQTEESSRLEVEDIDSASDTLYQAEALDEIFNDVAVEQDEPETNYQDTDQQVEDETSYQDSYIDEEYDTEDTFYEETPSSTPLNSLPTDAQYGPVVSGESLSVIAAELQRQFPDLTIYQIMKVLFEENKGAFIDENINGLLAGAVLNIGDLDAIRAVDVAQARQFFYDQLTDWDPSSLLPSSPSSNDGLSVAQNQYNDDVLEDNFDYDTGANDITVDNFQVGASADTEAIVSGGDGDNREAEVLALQQQISELESSVSSSSLENQELSARISLLEGQLADMNRLISLGVEDVDLASLEASLAEVNNAIDEQAEESFSEQTETDENILELGEPADLLIDENDDTLLTLEDDSILIDEELLDDEILIDEGSVDVIESVIDSVDDTAVSNNLISESTPQNIPALNSRPSKGEGLFDNLFDNSLWMIVASVGGLLLIGLVVLVIRRRRADEEFEISMLSIETQSESVNEANATVSEASIGAPDRETSFLTVYSDSDAVVQADEVDPIAEADVYIAYGRDEQAEEVLLDGIVRKPERIDIKQKLLGLYHKNSNVEGFERMAEELYSQKDYLTSSVWQEISLMGKDIAPDNPLFEVSASQILADEVLHSDKAVTSEEPLTAAVADTDASEFLTIAEFDRDETSKASTAPIESDSVQLVMDDEDASIHLINFDEGRSEISELDQVGIDALAADDSETGVTVEVLEEEVVKGVDLSETLEFEKLDVAEDSNDDKSKKVNTEVSELEIDADYDESRTQFELAKVFVDLGDEDGARKILADIVSDDEADKELVSEAVALLESINS